MVHDGQIYGGEYGSLVNNGQIITYVLHVWNIYQDVLKIYLNESKYLINGAYGYIMVNSDQ